MDSLRPRETESNIRELDPDQTQIKQSTSSLHQAENLQRNGAAPYVGIRVFRVLQVPEKPFCSASWAPSTEAPDTTVHI